jgi:C-terminal processing protease CtpA/Prc
VYQQHSATVIAMGAWNLANVDHLLDRTELVDPTRGGRRRGMRLMGVQLEDTEITEVSEEGMAERAHWQPGDVILSIDGVDVASRGDVVEELQKGGPRKLFKLRRGDEVVESVLDYTDTPSEIARERARAEEEAAAAASSDERARAEGAPAAGGR